MDDPASQTSVTGSRVDPAERGRLTVHDRVVERLAAHVARKTPGVAPFRDRIGKVTGQRLPRATAQISGQIAALDVDIAVTWESSLDEVAGAVRDAVREHLEQFGGLHVTRVNVTVKRIVREATQERRVQ